MLPFNFFVAVSQHIQLIQGNFFLILHEHRKDGFLEPFPSQECIERGQLAKLNHNEYPGGKIVFYHLTLLGPFCVEFLTPVYVVIFGEHLHCLDEHEDHSEYVCLEGQLAQGLRLEE